MNFRIALALFVLAGFTTLSLPRPAVASQVLALGLPALTGEADTIVVADVVAVTAAWTADRKTIVSTVELAVGESWKGGAAAGQRLRVVQIGGAAEGIEMKVHGMPRFQVGQQAVLFLRAQPGSAGKIDQRRPATTFSVVGMAQGLRDLVRASDRSATWMVAPPDHGAVVKRRPDGVLQPEAPPAAVPLNEFRAAVGKLVATQAGGR